MRHDCPAHRLTLGVALAFTVCLFVPAGSTHAATRRSLSRIDVVGSAEVRAKPDTATVHIGVRTEAETAAAALHENNLAMRRLRTLLARRGVTEADVQTGQFAVTPRYQDKRNAPERLLGYRVTHQLKVTVRRLRVLGDMLDAAVGSGANRITAITFSTSDSHALLDRARRQAVADARHRAALYAEAAGLELGPVTGIAEQDAGGPVPAGWAANAYRGVPIAPGEITVRATVKVTFSAHPR